MLKKNTISQLPLEFAPCPSLGREDFLVAPCNVEAAQMVDSWPDWPEELSR